MIRGYVTDHGVPQITIRLAGQLWVAVIDTGFNGDVELPQALQPSLDAEYIGVQKVNLAAGRTVVEDLYEVRLEFDGVRIWAEATFVPNAEVLIGTRLLRRHRLEIDFPAQTLQLVAAEP